MLTGISLFYISISHTENNSQIVNFYDGENITQMSIKRCCSPKSLTGSSTFHDPRLMIGWVNYTSTVLIRWP